MSVSIMASVFKYNMHELKTDDGKTVPDSTAKFVLLALADNAGEFGENAYPGVDTLCKKTNFSTSTVCNALNALRSSGYIVKVGKSKRDTNNYTIQIDRISATEISATETLGFQPPKRSDSSHRNLSVSATETKPSINHPYNHQKNNHQQPPEKTFIDPVTDAIETARRFAPAAELSLAIESHLQVYLGLNATGTKGGMEFINHAVKRAKDGEDYRVLFEWWLNTYPDRKYWSFPKMKENWPAAFMEQTANKPVVTDGKFYA
jgi:hypothetical protein